METSVRRGFEGDLEDPVGPLHAYGDVRNEWRGPVGDDVGFKVGFGRPLFGPLHAYGDVRNDVGFKVIRPFDRCMRMESRNDVGFKVDLEDACLDPCMRMETSVNDVGFQGGFGRPLFGPLHAYGDVRNDVGFKVDLEDPS
ncbi:hypothetical protein Ae201684P_007886 [Aphanomyces euteiches]|nr:hypothetical protein Ae201684P_007886 [Aphanomyces euteiches]